jgi:hypothetical protein
MFWKLLFIGKNIVRSPNLVAQLFFFFCKFDFFLFLFLDFSYQHRLEMKKIGDFKYNALKVERVPKIFEILNSFDTMLKMLQTTQIY